MARNRKKKRGRAASRGDAPPQTPSYVTKKSKLLILGSGPSAEFVKKMKLDQFEVMCLNNAWRLPPTGRIDCWITSPEFESLAWPGSLPDDNTRRRLRYRSTRWRGANFVDDAWLYDTPREKSVLFLDIMSPVLQAVRKNKRWKEIWFLGMDHDYSESKSHFYGTRRRTTPEAAALLKENAPEYADVAADPLMYGQEWLMKHFRKTKELADEYGVKLVVASCKTGGPLWQGLFVRY